MDKIRLTNHIKDEELRTKVYKVIDNCNSVLKNHSIKATDFLNPFEIKNAIAVLNTEPDLIYKLEGGYSRAVRQVMIIGQYYVDLEDETALRYFEIRCNFKFKSVSHRDYLGSILGLGIKREKLGDLLVHEDFCQIIVSQDMGDYILYNLERVGRNTVSVKEIGADDIIPVEDEFEVKSISVSSLRLDNLIAGVFNLSRQESIKYISADYVTVNYEKINNPSKQVEVKAVVSVRKRGKFILDELGSISKKGKIRIKVSIYK